MRFPLMGAAALLLLAATGVVTPARAQAEENILRGPHPFLKDNELSAHVLLAAGLGDTPSGTKVALDYGYKAYQQLWVDLQLNLQHGSCQATPSTPACGTGNGDAFETLGGVKWKWATAIPVVPYAKAGAGLVFVFPSGAHAALGFAARGAGGANYFFYDWLGIGAEVGFSVGSVAYDSTFTGSHAYTVIDFGGGLEFQF